MESRKPPDQSAPVLKKAHSAEIVDRLYEVALDPIRLEELMDVWESRIGPLRADLAAKGATLHDREIEAHLERASVFLDRNAGTREDGGYRAILDEIARTAAFVSDGGAAIIGFNRAGAVAFGLQDGAKMADLPFEPEDIARLRAVIARVAAGREEKVVTLRVRMQGRESPVIVRVGPLASGEARPLALVVSTELVWPDGFGITVQEAFGLTAAEVAIVRAIALGHPVKEIAEARGRSAETVRTQLRSILAKTETHSQSELVRVVLGLMEISLLPAQGAVGARQAGTLEMLAFQSLRRADGRRLDWIEFGDAAGAPCLFMHLDYGLIRWPAAAERRARQLGIRVIVPVRAGYGQSDLHAWGRDHLAAVTEDYLAVLDHLALSRVAVIAMGADLRFALNLSLARPDLVTGILGCACQLPLRTAAQYERMDKWQRFILANARYAPRVLPFMVKAGFALARRLGKEKFFAQVNGGSAADMATFARPEVREAILAGSEVCLGAQVLASEAFTRECIGSEKDWSGLVKRVQVPVVLLQGDQDPQTPVQTIRELMAEYTHLRIEFLPNTGQLLFFAEWPRVLLELERFLPRR